MTTAAIYQNGGWIKYPDRVTTRTFFRSDDRYTTKVTVKQGNVLKAHSFVESIRGGADAGKVKAHTGLSEAAIVRFTAALTAGQTLIVGGLTFTAGASGTTIAQLVTAFSGLYDGITAAAATTLIAANGVTAAMGTFTAGTLSGWNTIAYDTVDSVHFRSTTYVTNVTDLAFTGTGTAPTISKVDGAGLLNFIAGVTVFDVDATNGDVETTIYTEASFYAEALVWAVSPLKDYITDSLGNIIYCTAYNIGVYGPDAATTIRLQRQFVEQSEFATIGFLSESPALGGSAYNV